ncbi:MAG: AI-2E family transporter [Lachnospiraceae bacterium]|jgi:predicted PurR-regulated permease PerM|nr:AI-2E family transporter [Lachnospiraceae bacterium]
MAEKSKTSQVIHSHVEKEKEKVQNHKEERKPVHWLQINPKYMSVCRYALFVITASILIYILVSHWGETKAFISNLFGVLSPFFIGTLAAYFLIPLVAKIQGMIERFITKGKAEKIVKVISIAIAYVVVLGFIAIAFVFVIPQMGQSIQELTEKIPSMYRQVMKELSYLQERYPDVDFKFVDEQFNKMLPNLMNYGTNLVGSIVPMLYSVSVSIVKLAINSILGIFISIYMIYSKDKFRFQAKRVVYAFLSEEKGDAFCTTFRECNDIFGAFLISKAIDSLIIGCICCVVMNIIGLPYSVLLSVIVGITNMIPYFGPFIGAVPGVLIYLCTDWEAALIFAIMILAIQQFDGLILGPRLLGQSTGLSPIWVIFAITLGGAYFGVLGMFIGVPVVAVVAFLMNKLISARLSGKKVRALNEFGEQKK